MFVHGVDSDLDGLFVGCGFRHLPAVVPASLDETLPAGLAQSKTKRFIRSFVERFALGFSALPDLVGGEFAKCAVNTL